MKIILDKIEIDISKTTFGKVNVEFNGQTILIDDSAESAIEILRSNYEKIKSHYASNISKNQIEVEIEDLNSVCVKILFYYLDQFSRWKGHYKKSNYNIKFYEKDFDQPSTHDIVIFHLRDKHPDNWRSLSERYLNMTTEQFDFYWSNRLAYFNK